MDLLWGKLAKWAIAVIVLLIVIYFLYTALAGDGNIVSKIIGFGQDVPAETVTP